MVLCSSVGRIGLFCRDINTHTCTLIVFSVGGETVTAYIDSRAVNPANVPLLRAPVSGGPLKLLRGGTGQRFVEKKERVVERG